MSNPLADRTIVSTIVDGKTTNQVIVEQMCIAHCEDGCGLEVQGPYAFCLAWAREHRCHAT